MIISWIDIFVIVIAIFSGILSASRGFSREFLSLVSLLLSAYIAYAFYPNLIGFFSGFIHKEAFCKILSIASLFIISFVILSLIFARIAESFLSLFLAPVDKFLGMLYGVARGILICSMAAFLITNISVKPGQKTWLTTAKTYPMLYNIGETIFGLIPKNIFDIDKVLNSQKNQPLIHYSTTNNSHDINVKVNNDINPNKIDTDRIINGVINNLDEKANQLNEPLQQAAPNPEPISVTPVSHDHLITVTTDNK